MTPDEKHIKTMTTFKASEILKERIIELIGKLCNPILNFISKHLP